MDRLSCTLGVLADMVVAARSRTAIVPGLDPLRDNAQVASVMAQVLAMMVAAAHHALAHIPLQDANRPLAIAQYAEQSLDALGNIDRSSALTQVASFAPPSSPRGPNEQLEAALRAWASHARVELARTVPSTEVLRNIANQARHLYAVSARLVASREARSALWLVGGAGGSCGVCCNSSNDKIHHGPGQLAGVLVRMAVRFPVPDIDGVEAAQ